jgi:hypothetical protein
MPQGDGQEADKPEEKLTKNLDQGVCRSKRNNKGMTAKYADYGLMMNVRQPKEARVEPPSATASCFSWQKT